MEVDADDASGFPDVADLRVREVAGIVRQRARVGVARHDGHAAGQRQVDHVAGGGVGRRATHPARPPPRSRARRHRVPSPSGPASRGGRCPTTSRGRCRSCAPARTAAPREPPSASQPPGSARKRVGVLEREPGSYASLRGATTRQRVRRRARQQVEHALVGAFQILHARPGGRDVRAGCTAAGPRQRRRQPGSRWPRTDRRRDRRSALCSWSRRTDRRADRPRRSEPARTSAAASGSGRSRSVNAPASAAETRRDPLTASPPRTRRRTRLPMPGT